MLADVMAHLPYTSSGPSLNSPKGPKTPRPRLGPTCIRSILLSTLLLSSRTHSALTAFTASGKLPRPLSPELNNVHAVKAWDAMGPDITDDDPFNSLSNNAPVQLFIPTKSMCAELIDFEAPRNLLPPGTFTNTTILVFVRDLVPVCSFSHFFSNAASLYLSLTHASAPAVLLVTDYTIPGAASKVLSNRSDQRRQARMCQQPFIAIGASAGKALETQMETYPEATVHFTFTADENR